MNRSDEYMPRILSHEGGYVNNPKDPGGATNRGVTIGTLRKLGIDKDGDGDSDVVDLKLLTAKDAAAVFKRFYADPVQADLLPRGLDYAMTDFAVNSGPSRAAQHLQRILGVTDDGHIGPATIRALAGRDVVGLINALCDSRLRFMRNLKTWSTFGKGWAARVAGVRADAIRDAAGVSTPSTPPKAEQTKPAPTTQSPAARLKPWAFFTGLLSAGLAMIFRNSSK